MVINCQCETIPERQSKSPTCHSQNSKSFGRNSKLPRRNSQSPGENSNDNLGEKEIPAPRYTFQYWPHQACSIILCLLCNTQFGFVGSGLLCLVTAAVGLIGRCSKQIQPQYSTSLLHHMYKIYWSRDEQGSLNNEPMGQKCCRNTSKI